MKNNRLARHLIGIAISATLCATFGCESEDSLFNTRQEREYMPLSLGVFQVYAVHEIRYQLGVPETLAYQLKVLVTDSFPSAGGNYTYVLTRSKRETGGEWNYLDTWSARVNDSEFVVNEANISYLKVRLPLVAGNLWNGNTYNVAGDDEYRLTDLQITQEAGGAVYPDCIYVLQADNEDYIVFLDQRHEIYARNVGLIYKEVTQLSYCTSTAQGCLGQQVIESGVVFKQTIMEYGIE
jgi:hypothetical protein